MLKRQIGARHAAGTGPAGRRCAPAGWLLAAAAGLVLIGLAGCARSEIADGSVTYNEALGVAENRLLLLNIARSSRGYPVYFTQIAKMTSLGLANGSSIRARIPWPYGPTAIQQFRLWPNLNLQPGLQMDTDPLLSQDFYRGYVKPATQAEIEYHLQYGWPRTLVYTLMIQQISISAKKLAAIDAAVDARSHHCRRDPADRDFCEAAAVESEFERTCPNEAHRASRQGTVLFQNTAQTRCGFLRFQTLIMKLRALHFTYLQRSQHAFLQSITESGKLNGSGEPTGGTSYQRKFSYGPNYCPAIEGFSQNFLGGPSCAISQSLLRITEPSGDFSLIPRSAESMVRFLGQVVQAELGTREGETVWVPQVYATGPRRSGRQPLFLVTHDRGGANATVWVNDEGEFYAIPASGNGVSLPTLALLAEFFGLQQSASNLPVTPTVNLLGR